MIYLEPPKKKNKVKKDIIITLAGQKAILLCFIAILFWVVFWNYFIKPEYRDDLGLRAFAIFLTTGLTVSLIIGFFEGRLYHVIEREKSK
jgi:magnesium-transporting ATPase (P-type)